MCSAKTVVLLTNSNIKSNREKNNSSKKNFGEICLTMATLDDKLLGEKLHYYCSSSEDEDEDEEGNR